MRRFMFVAFLLLLPAGPSWAQGRESVSAGVEALRAGQNQEAVDQFGLAIGSLDHSDTALPDAYLGRSCAYEKLGENTLSSDDFDKFLNIVRQDFTDPIEALTIAIQVRSVMCG